MTAVRSGEILVSVCGRTDRGRVRSENQDSLLVADLARLGAEPAEGARSSSDRFLLGPRGALFFVADGMGGALGGATASRMAVASVRADFANGWARNSPPLSAGPFALQLRQALESAHARIRDESARDASLHGMGTTATLAGLLGDQVFIAQVGDSRAYLVRNGAALQLTRDQSVVQDFIDAGVMTEEEARHNVHTNTILQALGVAEAVRPELTFHSVRRGDVLLLCSDGLSRVVRDAEIAERAGAEADPAELCQRLIDLANERGGPDNITVVAARVEGEGTVPPRPDEAMARRSYTAPGTS